MKLNRNEIEEVEEDVEEELDDEDEFEDDEDDYLGDDLGDDFYGDGGQPPIDKHPDLLKNLTNFDPYLRDTFNNWLGLTWDEEKEKFVKNDLLTPIMNTQGGAWCLGLLKTYTRGNNIITDIGSDEFKNFMMDHIEAIWLNLGTREDLGITEDGDLIRVANEMEHAAALVLMGAGDGKYNKMLGTTYSHHTSGNVLPNQHNPNQVQVGNKPNTIQRIKRLLVGN